MHQPVSSLNLPDHLLQKLHNLGYFYCKDIKPEVTDFNVALTSKEWKNLLYVPKTKTALDIYQEECEPGSIFILNKALDDALDGGVPMGLITEFAGAPGSCKTQLCFRLCVNVQLPTWCGGLAGEAVYLSTNKGFASQRLKEIATLVVEDYNNSFKEKSGNLLEEYFTVQAILKGIQHMNISDHIELIAAIKYLEHWLKHSPKTRLIVIDSISAIIKQADVKDRPHIVYTVLRDLQVLSEQHKFAIVLTNDMTTKSAKGNTIFHTPALGGHYYHRVNIRVELSKVSAAVFKARIAKSILTACGVVEFQLSC